MAANHAGVACAKNVLEEHDAVSEMKVDTSKSVCRNRLQTAVSCFSPKSCGGERRFAAVRLQKNG